jgi:hypothetical protein
VEAAAAGGDDDESLAMANEKLGQQTGRKQQEWWLGLGILVDIGEVSVESTVEKKSFCLPLYRAIESGRTVPEE